MKLVAVSICLLSAAGLMYVASGPRYVDESRIPCVYGDNEAMGKLYPHIIIEGEKLDYHAKDKHYHFARGGPRAIWMEIGGDEKTPPKRILGSSQRDLPDGSIEEWKGGKWVPFEFPPCRAHEIKQPDAHLDMELVDVKDASEIPPIKAIRKVSEKK